MFTFLCLLDLQYTQYCLFFDFWFLCLLIGVFNLYSTCYFYFFFSFYITIVVQLYGTAHEKK
jgi:hypothetical protein